MIFCRVASEDWRPGRVYFLTLLEPLAGATGLWPLPPGGPVPATVGELSTTVDWFTAHAVLVTVRVGIGGVQPGPLACLEVFAVFGTGP